MKNLNRKRIEEKKIAKMTKKEIKSRKHNFLIFKYLIIGCSLSFRLIESDGN